jgi:butyrate kinase
MLQQKILIIYPEVRKTRIALYRNSEPIFLKTIQHPEEDLARFKTISDQLPYRTEAVIAEIERNDFKLELIAIVMARSGLVKPLKSGIYRINERMVEDLKIGIMGVHATNLGGLIAYEIAKKIGVDAFMADPVVVDELTDMARITGHPIFERKSIFHALSHKHFARKYAKSVNKSYEELNLIVCHIGLGGISIGAHQKGLVVDVNQAFDGGGPFSITRTGTLPVGQLVRLCYSGKYTEEQVMEMITSKGGYYAYLGTDSITQIDRMIADGDEKALFISRALAYQVSKEIASYYAVLEGDVDAIILTGNIFNSERFLDNVKQRVGKMAPMALYPTINDLEAHAVNAMMVLKGEAEVKEYE